MSNPGEVEIIEPELPLEIDAEVPENEIVASPDDTTPPAVDELAELRKQLAEEKTARAEAESRANSLHTEKTAAETRVNTEITSRFAAQENAVETKLSSAKSTLSTSKTELARAYAEQRFEDVADLQEKIASAKWDENQATAEKAWLADQKTRAQRDIEAQNARSADPVETFINTIPGGPSKQWLRSHPEVLRKAANSANEQKRLFGAAQLAEADGNAPDSPEYFAYIEKQLGLTEADPVTTTPKPVPKPAAKDPGRTANAAPTNRSTQTAQPSRVVKLEDVVRKLNDTDRANARISFPDKSQDEAEKLFAQGLVISKQREPTFRPDIRL